MIPKQEFNQLTQFYKGQMMENPTLEKAAQLSVQQHHQLLTDPVTPPALIRAQVKPLGRELRLLQNQLQDHPPLIPQAEEEIPSIEKPIPLSTPPIKTQTKRRKKKQLLNAYDLCQNGKIGLKEDPKKEHESK